MVAASGLLLAAWLSPAPAQVILPPMPPADPPWNALEIFEPLPFAQQWERATIGKVAPEDTPVKTRQHPGYEPVGARLGSWMFNPSLTARTTYDSNVFASNTLQKGDVALQVLPVLRANTLWERHSISLQGDLRTAQYSRYSNLNYTDANFRARGRIDLSHASAILAHFRAAHLNEPIGSVSSPAGAIEPTPYSFYSGGAAYRHQFNRLTASFGTQFDSYDYGSTRAQDGSIIDQSSRDGQIYVGFGRLDYAFSPAFGLFSALEINRRTIRGTPTQPLGSNGYRVLGGVNMQLARLVTGEIGIGYAEQRFEAATIGTIAGPSYRAILRWSPTRMVDVFLRAERIVTQTSDTSASGIRADAIQAGFDYEFRRNVVFSLSGIYEKDRFFGQDRTDDVYSSLAEARYLLNRRHSISLRHRYVRRDSSDPIYTYDKHEVGVDVTARF